MLLKQWQQYSKELIYSKGYDEYFFPFVEIGYDSVEDGFTSNEEINYVGTRGISSHKDIYLPRYCYHLIVKNNGIIAKGVNQSIYDYSAQIPGAILVLDAHQSHHAIKDERWQRSTEKELWISACFDSDELIDDKVAIAVFNDFLDFETF